ncbi:MAG: hypothetical protein FWD71_14610 [Oscillospiraceae bacterium]|nr:hypothetical protein [Oscillospiraceae bacterium]
MKKIFKIIILLILSIFIASAVLYSCKDTKKNMSGNTNAPEDSDVEATAEPAVTENLPEEDFGGYNFRIYLQQDSGKDLYVEEQDGDIIDDAVYKRNSLVEARFNINITPVYHENYDSNWNNRMDGAKSILAGDDAYDLMSFHGRIAFDYANKGLVVNWLTDMPYVDLTAPWWNQDVIQQCSFFGKLYGVTGDISYGGLDCTMCVLFNKNLFQTLDIAYPYNDVVNGTWTLDKFMSIVKSGSADLNGDGVMSPDKDRYGFDMGNLYNYPTTVLYCGGDRVITKDDSGNPVLSLYNERTVDIYNKLFTMTGTGGACIRGSKGWGNPDSIDIFQDGRALFVAGQMNRIIVYRAMTDEIGILPAPKYDESTPKYYALVEAHGGLLVVPNTAEDLERTSIITEALCAEGQRTIIPQYYETALKTKFARDDESSEMLDYIKDSAVYDYGYLNYTLTNPLSIPVESLLKTTTPNFTSFYDKNTAKVQSNIDNLIAMN